MTLHETIASLNGAYEIRGLAFTDDVFSSSARQLVFSGVTFTRCRFADADLTGCEFSGCVFVSCDLSGAKLGDSYFSRTELRSVKGVGTGFTRAILRDTVITGSMMQMANFTGARWDHVQLRQTNLREASLSEIAMRESCFQECDLTRAEIFRTRLNGMDLRECTLDGLALSDTLSELRGAVIDEMQASALVRRLGVLVR